MYFLIRKKDYFLPFEFLPVALFLLLTLFFSFERVVLAIVFFTPLAVTLRELGISMQIDLSLPTEPIMAGTLILMLMHQLRGNFISKAFLSHPISILIFIQLFWILITAITSEMPLVSVKFLIARLWFLGTAFFMASYLFNQDRKSIIKFLLAYILPLALVIIYTLINHAAYAFDEDTADWIVSPFYNDHTAYGAAIAMFIPVLVTFLLRKDESLVFKPLYMALLILFLTGVTFSYARAAWLSLAVAIGMASTIALKIKFRTILITLVSLIIIFLSFQTEILRVLNKNTTDSEGDLSANVESMTNIKTDASNVERLNRWSCAIEMFKQRPWLGWGPGTYMFQYAPFQKKSERSYISTNNGDNGNAHSEYLGPLAEQGIFGLLIVIGLMLTVFSTGYRYIYSIKKSEKKLLAIGVLLGLCTYFAHGFLNNFLDTDKLAVPFYGFITILICMDTENKTKKEI